MRHGEKAWENGKSEKYPFNVDAPLVSGNDIRRQKAVLLGVQRVITSPYLRCRQTAELISEGKIPIIVDSDLKEYIRWFTPEADPELDPETRNLLEGPIVESSSEFRSRMFRLMTKDYFQDDTLIISHAAVLKYITKYRFGRKISYGMGMFVSIIQDVVPSNDPTLLVLEGIDSPEPTVPNTPEPGNSEKGVILDFPEEIFQKDY